jgi:DNA-binding transcriptional MerR regulator
MTPKEICNTYDQASDKRKAIKMIARIECCGVEDIKELLRLNDRELPPETRGRKPKKACENEQTVKVSRDIPEVVYTALYEQIAVLEKEIRSLHKQINEKEKQYKDIADFLYGKDTA